MANLENTYQINYNGVDIQKQLDYVDSIAKAITKNTDDTININQLKTADITTNNLTSTGNIILNGALLSAKDTTAIFNNVALSSITISNSVLNDVGLTVNTIRVKDDTKETYITPSGMKSENISLGNADGSASIAYWSADNPSTGGKTYGLEMTSPINYDTEGTSNTLTIKNANTTLIIPNENDVSTTTSYSFKQLAHRLNYVGSLENFLPITTDASTSFSRININNVDTITSSVVNATNLFSGGIYNTGTITTTTLNSTNINASVINANGDNGQANISTATINELNINELVNASSALATFNTIAATDITASTITVSTITGANARLNDLNSVSISANRLTVNEAITSLSVDNLSVNQPMPSLTVNNLNVDTITAPAFNYVSQYMSIDASIEINNSNYENYNGMLLIVDNTADITISFNNELVNDIELEVLRFNTGNVALTSTGTNIIANAKLASSATIKKQYEVVGVKNFIHNEGVYWLISGNVSA